MCNAGTAIYGFSLFIAPVTSYFNFQQTQFIAGLTIFTILSSLLSPVVGKSINKFGLKKPILLGALFFGLGFIVLGLSKNIYLFYLGYGIVGIGASFTGPVIGSTVAVRWFNKNRGLATGIATSGIGVGSFVIVPIIQKIISNYGFSKAYFFMAILNMVVISIVTILFIKENPSDLGLFQDGKEEGNNIKLELDGLSSKEAISTPTFWIIGIGLLLYSLAQFGTLQTQNPYLQSISFKADFAAQIVAIIGIVSSLSKIIFGILTDKLPLSLVTSIGFITQSVGIFILYGLTNTTTESFVLIYSIIFGLGVGCWQPILSKHLTKSFGVKYFPQICGTVCQLKAGGDTLGPILASLINDRLGSYSTAYLIFSLVTVVSLLLFIFSKSTNKFKEKATN